MAAIAPQTALVTGASGGIGYELAKLFAQDGTSLVLVARHEEPLRQIKQDFEQRYGIQVACRALDLSGPGAATAFQPVPWLAAYAASKSYVMHFTEALHAELRGTGVSATVLNPGVTKTGFVARANMGQSAEAQGNMLDAAQVALAGYRGLLRGQLNVVPGLRGQLLAISTGLMPSRRRLLAIAERVSRPTK